MQAIVKYIHAISSCAKDVSEETHEINTSDLESAEAARDWLKKICNGVGLLKDARHTDCGGWVFFPMRRRGSVWWSVSIRLDVAEVRKQAEQCKCRNCTNQFKGANQ